MSKKITLLILAASALLLLAPRSEAAFQLKRLGTTHAFYQPDLKSQADVQKMLQINRDAIQQVLTKVGWQGNLDDLMKAAESGTIGETTIEPGANIPFMAMRRNRKTPDAMRDVVWAGKTSIAAYYIDFESGGTGWRFYAPKICSNFWMEERPIEKPAPPPPPPPEPSAPPAPAPEPTPAPPSVTPPPPTVPAAEEEGLFFLAGLVGKQRRLEGTDAFQLGKCIALLGVKGGILPRLGDKAEAEISAGLKFELNNDDNPLLDDDHESKDVAVFIDAALHRRFNNGFVGAGLSFWDLNDSTLRTVALLVQFGVGNRVGLLVEGRLPFKDIDVQNNYQFWGGIRIRP